MYNRDPFNGLFAVFRYLLPDPEQNLRSRGSWTDYFKLGFIINLEEILLTILLLRFSAQ
jgi:hypothetical protein